MLACKLWDAKDILMNMRTIGLLAVLTLMAACAPVTRTSFPTETPAPTLTPTATIVWFPATNTPTVFPTVEVSPTKDWRPGIGDLLLEDDFSDGENWSLATTSNSSVAIANNRLTLVLSLPQSFLFTTREQPIFGDFYAEIIASPSLCRRADEYGLLVRAASAQDYYRFSLSCDGQARVDRILGGVPTSPVPWTKDGAVPTVAPSTIRLGVWALGDELRFFIGDHYLFSVRDTVFLRGTLGVFVRTAGGTAVSVSFEELKVWEVAP